MGKVDALTTPPQSAMLPQCDLTLKSKRPEEVLPNEWLGGRDSNPDTQIQSPSPPIDSKPAQQLTSANSRQDRQNPQCRRNTQSLDSEYPDPDAEWGGEG